MPPPNLKTLTTPPGKTPASDDPSERRGFFGKFAAVVIGGLVMLFPFAAGLLVFADPLRRKAEGKRYLKVTALDSVPDDGVPRAFPVTSSRTDAWTYYPSQPIGAVYLRRQKGKILPVALQTTCPHAGCRVDFLPSDGLFRCPCHNSAFDLNGEIRQPSPSPRPMDQLACEIRSNQGVSEVWVEFQDFYTGVADKVAKT